MTIHTDTEVCRHRADPSFPQHPLAENLDDNNSTFPNGEQFYCMYSDMGQSLC